MPSVLGLAAGHLTLAFTRDRRVQLDGEVSHERITAAVLAELA